MKAISIVNQVGQKITLGEKTLEIRKWQSNIDAEEELLIVENSRYLESDMAAACTSYYELGWLAWKLTDIRAIAEPIAEPIEVIAKQKIYEVELILEPKKNQHD
ncbi:hypothetical protein QP597_07090 [Providencia stuartii]|nr:hypothetical protein [Providencia stuartii]